MNRSSRGHRQSERSRRKSRRLPEQRRRKIGDSLRHAVALNGDDASLSDRVQQIEGKVARFDVELDPQLFRSMFFFEFVRFGIDFRSADHDDAMSRPFREEMGAEVVAAHVSGEKDRAAARLHCLEVLVTRELPIGNYVRFLEAHVVGERPREVPEDAIGAKKIGDGGRSWLDRFQIAHDAAAGRCPEQKKQRP